MRFFFQLSWKTKGALLLLFIVAIGYGLYSLGTVLQYNRLLGDLDAMIEITSEDSDCSIIKEYGDACRLSVKESEYCLSVLQREGECLFWKEDREFEEAEKQEKKALEQLRQVVVQQLVGKQKTFFDEFLPKGKDWEQYSNDTYSVLIPNRAHEVATSLLDIGNINAEWNLLDEGQPSLLGVYRNELEDLYAKSILEKFNEQNSFQFKGFKVWFSEPEVWVDYKTFKGSETVFLIKEQYLYEFQADFSDQTENPLHVWENEYEIFRRFVHSFRLK